VSVCVCVCVCCVCVLCVCVLCVCYMGSQDKRMCVYMSMLKTPEIVNCALATTRTGYSELNQLQCLFCVREVLFPVL